MSPWLDHKKILLLLVMFSTDVFGKTHIVLVRDNSFNPATIVIEAGDTVRWVNEGPGSHNVYAVGRFRCANGCEANGGDGNPSNLPWVSEVTFRIPETIPYQCQPHVGFGMVGTVVVQNPSSGSTHQVMANNDNTFTPGDLEIQAGDVVFFNNAGGEHNFKADDDSLLCANGCEGDGLTVDTDPTGFPWEFYMRFNEVRDIPYHCANPAHSNQTAVLRIISDVIFEGGFE